MSREWIVTWRLDSEPLDTLHEAVFPTFDGARWKIARLMEGTSLALVTGPTERTK